VLPPTPIARPNPSIAPAPGWTSGTASTDATPDGATPGPDWAGTRATPAVPPPNAADAATPSADGGVPRAGATVPSVAPESTSPGPAPSPGDPGPPTPGY
jgi:hypothetical protein